MAAKAEVRTTALLRQCQIFWLMPIALILLPGCVRHNHSAQQPSTQQVDSVTTHPTSARGTGANAPDPLPAVTLAEARAQAKKVGLPLSPEELRLPLPPEDQNAAPIYRQLTRLLINHPLTQEDKILDNVGGRRMPTAAQCEQIRRALQHRQDLVQLVHQAAERPQCVFNRDYSLGEKVMFPELAKMRAGLRLLSAETTLLLHDGKPLDAIRNEALGFQMARHAAQEPTLIAYLVGLALDAITLAGMEKCLYALPDNPEVAQAVRESIEKNWQPHSTAYALHGEIVFVTVVMERQRKQGPGTSQEDENGSQQTPSASAKTVKPRQAWQRPPNWDALLDANEADCLQTLATAVGAADRPYLESEPIFREINASAKKNEKDPTHSYSAILSPLYGQSAVKRAQTQAHVDVVRCAAAVLAWRQQHGTFPDSLQQAMPTVPADAFDGQPLLYRREGTGFVVYSVGKTGKFDGGTSGKKPDSYESVFHFPIPAYYPAGLSSASTSRSIKP